MLLTPKNTLSFDMPQPTQVRSSMLLRYLHEQHSPVEHLLESAGSAGAGTGVKAVNIDTEKEVQAVKMLDKHVEAITNEDILTEADLRV